MAFRQVCFTLALSLSDESRDGAWGLPGLSTFAKVIDLKTAQTRMVIRLSYRYGRKKFGCCGC